MKARHAVEKKTGSGQAAKYADTLAVVRDDERTNGSIRGAVRDMMEKERMR